MLKLNCPDGRHIHLHSLAVSRISVSYVGFYIIVETERDVKIIPKKKPPDRRLFGGNMWGSNPPRRFLAPRNGFEDRGTHQRPYTPKYPQNYITNIFQLQYRISIKDDLGIPNIGDEIHHLFGCSDSYRSIPRRPVRICGKNSTYLGIVQGLMFRCSQNML